MAARRPVRTAPASRLAVDRHRRRPRPGRDRHRRQDLLCPRPDRRLARRAVEPAQRPVERTRATLFGWRRVLDEQGIRAIAPEAALSTTPRALAGHPSIGVSCSCRIDCVGLREPDNTTVLLDLKPHLSNALDLQESMATWVQWHIAHHHYPDLPIEIAHVAATQEAFVSVSLTDDLIERGRAIARAMALDVATRAFSATPGQHCATCGWRMSCDAWRGQAVISDNAAF